MLSAVYYTRNRNCRCLTRCDAPAIEVLAPRADTRAGQNRYIGNRICQCPDPYDQSEFSATVPFEPNKWTGVFNDCGNSGASSGEATYTCVLCQECAVGKYQTQRCTHARINMVRLTCLFAMSALSWMSPYGGGCT